MDHNTQQFWKILVVDDEVGLHEVTRLVLRRMQFQGIPVELLSAHSAKEAEDIIKVIPSIAVAILDVVMENDRAGLDLVHTMRNQYGMKKTRIILRTGNPGLAPPREVIQHFEIDDYRDKTELTADRLFTAVFTALRSFNTLNIIDETSNGLEQIIRSTESLLSYKKSNAALFLGLLTNLQNVQAITQSPLQFNDVIGIDYATPQPTICMAQGIYGSLNGKSLEHILDDNLRELLHSHLSSKSIYIGDKGILLGISSPNQCFLAIWIASEGMLKPHVTYLIQILLERFNSNLAQSSLQHEILEAQRTALGKLCEAVEMRSKETGQHIHRMAAYSKLLATLYGLPAEQIDLIEAAAPLHDIGKVAIPDSVLNKAGPLTPDEMMVMRTHSQNGYNLLKQSNSRMLQTGAEIALSHHERWDGMGYPNGLKSTDIPLFGRIVNVADVFDALMSKRIYKEAFPLIKTIEIMTDLSGKAFDPELIDLLVKHQHEFESIFAKNPDEVD
jgi:response regulator RpfG family c-di-GMP phosphodiesterase